MKNGSLAPRLLTTLLACVVLIGCGGGGGGDGSPLVIPDVVDRGREGDLRVYDRDGPYADVLVDCVEAERVSQSCRLSRLPLIGMDTENPTIDDIMQRLVVSHDWMAERFEQTLGNLPNDILLLLRATTAVVISSEIRPAYYTTLTGAVYLDPAYLWLTPRELNTISTSADPRSGYDDPLQFRSLTRYVRDGNYVYPFGLLQENPDKTEEDVAILLGELLFHELAHANDFLPPSSWADLNENDRVYTAIEAQVENQISKRLEDASPLESTPLYDLADVMYWGEPPSLSDLGMDTEEVGEEFEADGANDHYAYASIYEDTAMLFEEVMMRHHFGIDRDVAFTDAPDGDARYCESYVVRWGVRNRVGDPLVKERAQFVTGELLPSAELSQFFQDFPAQTFMREGDDWCESIEIAAPRFRRMNAERQELPPRDIRRRH